MSFLLGQCRLAWGVIRGLHAYIAVASDMRLAYTCRGMLAAHQQSPSVALLVSPLVQRGRLSSATSIDGDGVLCPGRGGIGTSPCEGRVTRLSMKNRSFAEVYLDGYIVMVPESHAPAGHTGSARTRDRRRGIQNEATLHSSVQT